MKQHDLFAVVFTHAGGDLPHPTLLKRFERHYHPMFFQHPVSSIQQGLCHLMNRRHLTRAHAQTGDP